MQNKHSFAPVGAQRFQPPRRDEIDVAEWLAEIEASLERDADDIDRKYTNIGGQNGLELFV